MDAAKTILIRLITSLKFWTTVLGLLSSWLAKKGIILDPTLANDIVYLTITLVGAQAVVGVGAQIAAASSPSSGTSPVAVGEVNISSPSADPRQVADLATSAFNKAIEKAKPEGGFVEVRLLATLALGLACMCGVLLVASCSATTKARGKAMAGDVIDCLKPDVQELVTQFGPTTEDLIRATLSSDGKVDKEALKHAARGYATAKAQCVMASALSNLLAASSRPPDPNAPASEAQLVDQASALEARHELFGGARFKTAHGEI